MRMNELPLGEVLVVLLDVARADGGKDLDKDTAKQNATQSPAHTAQRCRTRLANVGGGGGTSGCTVVSYATRRWKRKCVGAIWIQELIGLIVLWSLPSATVAAVLKIVNKLVNRSLRTVIVRHI